MRLFRNRAGYTPLSPQDRLMSRAEQLERAAKAQRLSQVSPRMAEGRQKTAQMRRDNADFKHPKKIARNIGENNPRCIISDEDVDTMRDLYEDDKDKPRADRYWTIARLMEKFDLSRRHVFNIVGYHQRADREEIE